MMGEGGGRDIDGRKERGGTYEIGNRENGFQKRKCKEREWGVGERMRGGQIGQRLEEKGEGRNREIGKREKLKICL